MRTKFKMNKKKGGKMKKIIDELLKLIKEHGVILMNKERDALAWDGDYALCSEEGPPRLHPYQYLKEEEARKILSEWLRKGWGYVELYIKGITPPYEKGIDWFT